MFHLFSIVLLRMHKTNGVPTSELHSYRLGFSIEVFKFGV